MHGFDADKRHLLQRGTIVRLPWALNEAAFTDGCTRCGDCVDACPERIIIKGRGGYPSLDFQLGECTFCGKCLDRCQQAIFQPRSNRPFEHAAVINAGCLPTRGVACRSCGDVCEVGAITFQFGANRLATPRIDADACTGCGACLSVCPVDVIALQAIAAKET